MTSARRRIADRGAQQRVRQLRRRLASVGGALLLLTLFTGLSFGTFNGSSLATAAIERARSFLELMQQRSPGKRTQEHLTKIKHKLAQRHERALPKVRIAFPVLPPGQPLVDIIAPPVSITTESLEATPIPPLFTALTLPPGSPFGPPPGVIVPPIVPTQNSSPPPVVTPPVSAVPEPATWMSMLLGFGLVGWRLRRRDARKPSSAM